MSSKIDKQDSQRSHLTSFTMKLMDKFHSPKIKRTPSKKGKQVDPTVKTAEKPVNKALSRLEEKEKEVVSALRYFKTIVDKMAIDKKVLEMLPGSASKVLEAIVPLVHGDLRIQQSSAVSSCYSRVYQSLANLIHWSDQVMLEGVNLEDKEVVATVTTVIKAVLDGVKELVRLTIEKQEHPSPTSPSKPSLATCKSDRYGAALLFFLCGWPSSSRAGTLNPTHYCLDYEVDCYVQRRLSGGSHSYGGESPRLSPCNSIGKLSKSDEQLSSLEHDSGQCSRNTSCETLDNPETYDPDYDFLHQDLSNTDQISHQLPSMLSPLPESSGESNSPCQGQTFQLPCPATSQPDQWCSPAAQLETPPALPEKKRKSTVSQGGSYLDSSGSRISYERHPSQYDNISEDDLQNLPTLSTSSFTPFAAVPPLQPGNPSLQPGFVTDFSASEADAVSQRPPPLPEKKTKHILTYMQFVEDYSEPQPSVFYQTPQNELIYQQKNKHLMEVYGFNDSFSSTDSGQEVAAPPALPPKQRQLQASYAASSSSFISCYVQQSKVPVPAEDAGSVPSISMSVSNSFLSRHSSFTTPSTLPSPSLSEDFPFPSLLPSIPQPFEMASNSWPVCLLPNWPFPQLPPSELDLSLLDQSLFSHPFFSQSVLNQSLLSQLDFTSDDPFTVWMPQFPELPLSFPSHLASLYKSVFRSYSQDFSHHSHASIPPFFSSASSHFPFVHQSRSSDLAAPATADQSSNTVDGSSCSSQSSSLGNVPVCLPSETSLTDSLQTTSSENASEEAGEGEYVNLYSSGQPNGELPHSEGESPAVKDGHPKDFTSQKTSNGKESQEGGERRQKPPDSPDSGQCNEEVDELSLVDHNDIVSRLTLKQEGDDGPDVRGGSGDILLVHATETDRKDLILYCEAFLTTYRTFISPEDLIKKLQYRYEKFCHCPDTFKKRVSKNTFFVLVRVVDELCLVELTDDILKLLMDLVFRLIANGELSLARVLRKNILDKVEQKKMRRCANSIKPLAARGVAARPGTLHDFHSHEIADQLTLLDAELFYKIEIPEVLLWAKEQNEEKSPNLTQFTEHFNNMSYWVRSIIIQQEKAQDRERLLLKFIKIMKHLRKLNNFNSYLAILSALDSAPIRRLEWQKQTSEGLAEYCMLIDSSSSFRAYRAALAEVEPPCIPYLGLILQDLTFVHLGNPDYIEGKINFSKRWQQFNILDSMRRFQQVHYEIKRNDDIVSFFNDFSDHLAEEALWELSLKIKPRNITRRKTEREEKT
nr:PREDICTED: rap guanine nucleotide exchange factor 1 [Latimeria chalumnae]|eukprot:XP_014340836.1 PREDICTED: rap guanine nucleotide exchange factor 1 [Latimeria chalumnae]